MAKERAPTLAFDPDPAVYTKFGVSVPSDSQGTHTTITKACAPATRPAGRDRAVLLHSSHFHPHAGWSGPDPVCCKLCKVLTAQPHSFEGAPYAGPGIMTAKSDRTEERAVLRAMLQVLNAPSSQLHLAAGRLILVPFLVAQFRHPVGCTLL